MNDFSNIPSESDLRDLARIAPEEIYAEHTPAYTLGDVVKALGWLSELNTRHCSTVEQARQVITSALNEIAPLVPFYSEYLRDFTLQDTLKETDLGAIGERLFWFRLYAREAITEARMASGETLLVDDSD